MDQLDVEQLVILTIIAAIGLRLWFSHRDAMRALSSREQDDAEDEERRENSIW